MIKTIVTAIITYLATSIDEIPVLFLLYKKVENKGKGKRITVAYFTGTFLLAGLGLLGAFGLLQLPKQWMIGLIGLLPIVMGITLLIKGDEDEEKAIASTEKQKHLWIQVLIITMTLGADDLGVYIPLFTTMNGAEVLLMLLVFAAGTAGLCSFSYRITRIEKLSRMVEKQERFTEGIVFIAIGIFVMIECRTFIGIADLL